ncbi:MAG: tetratricopeptide repeat protein [Candidatus Omnitrophica bacterium]|nr:tetratricopeptide repeat protein [Candidatus Omnitrophota bacterium]
MTKGIIAILLSIFLLPALFVFAQTENPQRKEDLVINRFVADKPYSEAVHQGNIYIDAGMYSQAAETFEKAISMNPSLPDAYVDLACVYDRLDRIEEAIETLKKASEKAPGEASIYANLGFMYYRLGEFRQAKTNLQKGKELYVKRGEPQLALNIDEVLVDIDSRLE